MRLIHYHVINKETNKREYTNCNESKCREYINGKEDKNNYIITYKWLSIWQTKKAGGKAMNAKVKKSKVASEVMRKSSKREWLKLIAQGVGLAVLVWGCAYGALALLAAMV